MENIWYVLGLALLPAIGNFGGGMLAEFLPTPSGMLNKALHLAAGIIIAVIAVELMPEALSRISGWTIGVAFGLGGMAYLMIQAAVEKLQNSRGGQSSIRLGMWMIYIAVAVDLFSDGILIGTGSAVSVSMALVLALGQVLADIPEGYATIVNMKDKGVPRSQRILLSISFAVPVLFSSIVAYYLLRDRSDVFKMAGLAFAAGLLAVAAVEDMLSEAHEGSEDTRWSVVSFTGGFVLFTFVAAGIGG